MFSQNWVSNSRRCFMGERITQTNFHYIKKWFDTYKSKRRYLTNRILSMHNNFAEMAHDQDEEVESFLLDLLGADGSKEPNMIVRIYADHGDHQTMFRETPEGDFDRHMPIMLTLIPKNFINAHKDTQLLDNFMHNSKRLTTSIDMFWTDLGIVGGRQNPEGESKPYGWLVKQVRQERSGIFSTGNPEYNQNLGYDLFNERVSDDRFCENIPFDGRLNGDISFHCHCKAKIN
jgi:phosphoglycerol transferase MdoB-like AlkP superfamily enzyme